LNLSLAVSHDLQGTPGSHYLQNIPSSQESHDLQEKASIPVQAPNDLQEMHDVASAAAAAVRAAAIRAAVVEVAAEELEAAGNVAAEESITTTDVAASAQLDAAATPSPQASTSVEAFLVSSGENLSLC
jgi:hypothetical protein